MTERLPLRESAWLGNLGNCYGALGQTDRSIDYYEQALEIAREVGDRANEGVWLGNLGDSYAKLDQAAHAINCCEQSLNIAREIGARFLESVNLGNLGGIHSDHGKWDLATQLYHEAIQAADEVGFAQFQNEARRGLALIYLYAGDLSAARTIAETAQQYEVPQNNDNVRALLGVIALRRGDRTAAQEAFAAAVDQAEALLGHSKQDYDALENKGLALCGLALCEESSDYVPAAIDAYRASRSITKDAGIIRRALRLFDALAQADSAGILAEVRVAVAGE